MHDHRPGRDPTIPTDITNAVLDYAGKVDGRNRSEVRSSRRNHLPTDDARLHDRDRARGEAARSRRKNKAAKIARRGNR